MKTWKRNGRRILGIVLAVALLVTAVINGRTPRAQAKFDTGVSKDDGETYSYCIEGYGTGSIIDPSNWEFNTIFKSDVPQKFRTDDYKTGIVPNNHSEEGEDVIRLINGVHLEDMSGKDLHRSGNAIMKKRVKLNKDAEFSVKFTVSMPDAISHSSYKMGDGGDGLVFLITNDDKLNGLSGGAIGYKGIYNSLGIELDSFYNTGDGMDYYDPSTPSSYKSGNRRDHVAVVLNGENTSPSTHIATSFLCEGGFPEGFTQAGKLTTFGEEEDNIFYTVWAEYDGETLYVAYAKGDFKTAVRPEKNQLVVNDDRVRAQLSQFANDEVKVGFTAGIGGSKANHTVHSVAIVNKYIEGGIKSTYVENYYVESEDATDDFVEIDGKKYVLAESNLVGDVTVGTKVTITDLNNIYGEDYVEVDYTDKGYPTEDVVAIDGSTVVNQFFALPHEHEFEYDAEGNKITAECEDDNCELNDEDITIEINAEDEYYTGNPYSSAEIVDELTSVTGDEVPEIYYEGVGEIDYDKTTTPPTEVGTYKATVSVGGVTAEDDFKIVELKITAEDEYYSGNPYNSDVVEAPLSNIEDVTVYYEGIGETEYEKTTTPPTEVGTYKATAVLGDLTAEDDFAILHVHEFEYDAEGNKITAECEDDDCELNDKEISIEINAEDEYYTGKPYDSAEIVDELTDVTGDEVPEIYYEGVGETEYEKSTTPPTEVGTYKATVSVGGVTAEDEFAIVELKITAEDEYYSGNPYSSATVETSIDSDEEPTVYYEGIGETVYEKTTTPPTEVGTYKAIAVLEDATAEDDFAIIHEHKFEYDAEGNKITAECEKDDCELNDEEISIEINAEDEYYTGKPYDSAEIIDNLTEVTGDKVPKIYYEGVGDTEYEKTTIPPTEIGTYKATVSVGDVTAEDAFEIKPHVHDWEYEGEGNVITGECIDENGKCDADTEDKKIEINADDMYYTGKPYDKAVVENDLSDVTGEYPTDIYYVGTGSTEYPESTTPPTEVGTYEAYVKIDGDVVAVDDFTIMHKHVYEYEAEGNKITGECEDEDCFINENEMTIVINAEDEYYSGNPYSSAKVVDKLTSVTGDEISDIFYVGTGDTEYKISIVPPTEVGTYKAVVSIVGTDVVAVDDFEIKPHVHDFEYEADGNEITGDCEENGGNCDADTTNKKVVINAEDEYYSGNPYSSADVVDELTNVTGDELTEIYYEGVGNTVYDKSTTAPTEVGTYKATVSIEGTDVTAEDEFKIKPHMHDWRYEGEGNVITGECIDPQGKCEADIEDKEIVITAPDMDYTGNLYDKAVVENDLSDVTGDYPSDIYYVGTGDTDYPETTTPPTEVGTYQAIVKMDGKVEAFDDFEILHVHEFEYDAEGNKITAECEDDDCEINDKEISIEINADDELYTGNPYNSAEIVDELTNITGDEVPEIYYEGVGDTEYEKTTTPPTEIGTYKATVTVGGVTAEDEFTIGDLVINAEDEYYSGNPYSSAEVGTSIETDEEPVIYYEGIGETTYEKSTTPPTEVGTYKATAELEGATASDDFEIIHVHEFDYDAEDNKIIADCDENGCDLGDEEISIEINAEDEYYTGNPYDGAEIVDKLTNVTGDEVPEIYYEGVGDTEYKKSTTPPTEPGDYKATVTVGGATAEDEFKIVELKINAEDEYYTGNPYNSAEVEAPLETEDELVVYYEGIGETFYPKRTTPPTEVGTYVATAVLGDATAEDEFKIIEHEHEFEYDGEGNKITGECVDQNGKCELITVDKKVEINAEDEYYSGNPYSSAEIVDNLTNVTGDELSDIFYVGTGDTKYQISIVPPTEVGTYMAVVAITGTDVVAADPFEIKPHEHDFEYEADDNKITGDCVEEGGNCDADTTDKKVVINADDEYYTGNPYSSADIVDSLTNVTGDELTDIYYEGVGETVYEKSTTAPTEIGTYKASVSIEGTDVTAEDAFEIKPHKHDWRYEGEGNVITGECIDPQGKCDADTADKEITITAPDMEYTGNPYDKAVVENDLSDVTGDYPSDIYYVGTGDTDYPETTTPPTEVGTYQAIVKMDGREEAFDDFEIFHVHEFEYDSEGNKITAECEDDDCELNDKEISIEINAEDEFYTGNPYSSAEIVDELTNVTGDEVPEIYYEGVGDTEYEKTTTPPTEIGTYKATVTVGGVTAEDEFEIADLIINAEDEYYSGNPYSSAEVGTSIETDEEPVIYYEGIGETVYEKTTTPPTEVGTYKATVELEDATASDDFAIIHVHDYDYEAEDNKITADCDEKGCDLGDDEISIEINAEDEYYTGNPYDGAEIVDKLTDVTGDEVPEIYYEGVGDTEYKKSTTPPTEPGDYKATVTVGGATAEDEFKIVELKITAEDEYYTGNPYSSDKVEAPLETEDDLVVYYEGIGETFYPKRTTPPTEVGTYVATVVLGEITAEDEFKIIPHEHDFEYDGKGNEITGDCVEEDGKCDVNTTGKKVVINAEDEYYTGNPYSSAEILDSLTTATEDELSEIFYVGTGDTKYPMSNVPPTKIGTYIAIVSIIDTDVVAFDPFEIKPHEHDFDYEADGNEITGDCVEEDGACDADVTDKKVAINAEDEYYTGNPYSSANIVDSLTTVTGDELSRIYYEGVGETVYEKSTEAPTEVGTYKATVSILGTDITAEDAFEIKPHVHSWDYDSDENVITGDCIDPSGKCEADVDDKKIEINADDMLYTGDPYDKAVVENDLSDVTGDEVSDIYYEGVGETVYEKTTTPPTEIGTYKATVTIAGVTAEDEFVIGDLVINAEDEIYSGNPYSSADVETSIDTDEEPVIYYEGIGGTEYEKTTTPPTEVGTYKATVTVGDATAEDDFEIIHVHEFEYDSEGNKITAECEDDDCDLNDKNISIEINADDEYYTGNPYDSAEIKDNLTDVTGDKLPEIYYEGVGETAYEKSTTPPTEPGTYKATVTIGEVTAEDEFAIVELKITAEDEYYTGNPYNNADVDAPILTGDELFVYYVGIEDTEYDMSTTAPTEVGTYKAIAVVGDATAEDDFRIIPVFDMDDDGDDEEDITLEVPEVNFFDEPEEEIIDVMVPESGVNTGDLFNGLLFVIVMAGCVISVIATNRRKSTN